MRHISTFLRRGILAALLIALIVKQSLTVSASCGLPSNQWVEDVFSATNAWMNSYLTIYPVLTNETENTRRIDDSERHRFYCAVMTNVVSRTIETNGDFIAAGFLAKMNLLDWLLSVSDETTTTNEIYYCADYVGTVKPIELDSAFSETVDRTGFSSDNERFRRWRRSCLGYNARIPLYRKELLKSLGAKVRSFTNRLEESQRENFTSNITIRARLSKEETVRMFP